MGRRLLATSAIAVGTGVLLAGSVAVAQDDDGGGWFTDALEELVTDGTLTPAQAEAVEDALREARPDRPFVHRHGPGGRGPLGMRIDLDDAADVIGIDDDELFDALRDGQTIAEVAEANGVDPQEVIDALTADVQERLDGLVADGELDEDAAAERTRERHRAHHRGRQRRAARAWPLVPPGRRRRGHHRHHRHH